MPRRKTPQEMSLEEVDNQARNELQKTLLLLEHRRLLRKERVTLLHEEQELVQKSKALMIELGRVLKTGSRRPERRKS